MLTTEQGGAGIEPLLVTVDEAIRLSGFSRSELYRRLASGELEARKIGRSVRIITESLRRLVASLPKAQFRARAKSTRAPKLTLGPKPPDAGAPGGGSVYESI